MGEATVGEQNECVAVFLVRLRGWRGCGRIRIGSRYRRCIRHIENLEIVPFRFDADQERGRADGRTCPGKTMRVLSLFKWSNSDGVALY